MKRSFRSRRTRPITTTTAPTASSAILAAGWERTSTFSTTSSTAAIPRGASAAIALNRDGEFARGRDRASGDYNDFWRERDLLTKVRKIRAAVFMAHAFNDWNVVPEHSVRIYEALKGRVPLRAYFHQGGHGGAPPLEMMNKWFTRYLYGVENGVEREPKAWIVERPSATGGTEPPGRGGTRPWPRADPAAGAVRRLSQSGSEAGDVLSCSRAAVGTGGLTLDQRRGQGRETLVDNVEFGGAALAAAETSPHRLLYATPELSAPLHLSGTPRDASGWRRASRRQTCRCGWWCCPGPADRSAPPT